MTWIPTCQIISSGRFLYIVSNGIGASDYHCGKHSGSWFWPGQDISLHGWNTGIYELNFYSPWNYQKTEGSYIPIFNLYTAICWPDKSLYPWVFYVVHVFTAESKLTKKICIKINEWVIHFVHCIHIFFWYIIDRFQCLTSICFQLCYIIFQVIVLVLDI